MTAAPKLNQNHDPLRFQDVYEAAQARVKESLNVQLASHVPELEEPGWKLMRGDSDGQNSINGKSRQEINNMAWHYFYNDPMVSHATNLHNVYTFGRGATVVVDDRENELLQDIIEEFWEKPTTQQVMGRAHSQYQLNTRRLLDGELFFLFYVNRLTGDVEVRLGNPSEFSQVVYHDNDDTRPAYYKRTWRPSTFNFERGEYEDGEKKTVYLPDYQHADADHGLYRGKMQVDNGTEVYVMHVVSNDFHGRGASHYATAIPWVRAFKGFMEDRVVLQIALATFAFKAKIDGNQEALNRTMSTLTDYGTQQNRYGTGEFRERRQGGNILSENQAFNLEQFKTTTGAGEAYTDGRMLRQLAGVGLGGIFEHYLAGDAATGNLATATAMELPMLKTFEYQQQFWRDVFGQVLDFVVLQAIRFKRGASRLGDIVINRTLKLWQVVPAEDVDLGIGIRFPEIVARDASVLLAGISQVIQSQAVAGRDIVPLRQMGIVILEAVGVDNPESVIDQMIDELPDIEDEEPDEPETPPEPEQEPPPEDEEDTTESDSEPDNMSVEMVRGEPLPDAVATDVEPFDEDEMADAVQEWRDLPPLEELMEQFDLTEDDVDNA